MLNYVQVCSRTLKLLTAKAEFTISRVKKGKENIKQI